MNPISKLAQLLDGSNLPHITDCDPAAKKCVSSLQKGLTITFVIIGSVGLLFLVIAGVRYVFARGDSNKISEAKNMIQHIIIGIVIAGLAASIVGVVVSRVQ